MDDASLKARMSAFASVKLAQACDALRDKRPERTIRDGRTARKKATDMTMIDAIAERIKVRCGWSIA